MDEIKATNANEKQQEIMLQAARRVLKRKGVIEQLEELSINWTDEHTTELYRLLNATNKALTIVDPEQGERELARVTPSFLCEDLDMYFSNCLAVIEAFGDEWANVLTDRGNQASLFDKGLTKKQRAAWANYYEMDADARRLYLLFAAHNVNFLKEVAQEQEAEKEPTRSYVSRGKMEKAGVFYDKTPHYIAIPTGTPYFDALTLTMPHTGIKDAALLDVGGPLEQFMNNNGLEIEDTGKLFKRAGGILSSREVADLLRKGKAGDEDYSAVYFVYSATIANYPKTGKKEIELCWNDIEGALNLKHGTYTREAFISRVRNLNNKIGYLKGRGYYAVCLFKGFDTTTNKMTLEAPYCIELIKAQEEAALMRGKKGDVLTSKDGRPKMRPTIASDLYMSALPTGRDNPAVFSLCVEVTKLVNRAGKNNTPHITWRNLINKVPGLLEKIQTSSNPRRDLKRLFSALWEKLKNDSKLAEKIVIPEIYPTLSTLDEIIEFRRIPSEITRQKNNKS